MRLVVLGERLGRVAQIVRHAASLQEQAVLAERLEARDAAERGRAAVQARLEQAEQRVRALTGGHGYEQYQVKVCIAVRSWRAHSTR
jgi:hypothetical protein